MQKVTIDASIAVGVDILNIGEKEDRKIYFKASEPWTGTYDFKIWNSPVKNTETVITISPLLVEGDLMTLNIKPENQSIPVDSYYFEIFRTDMKWVIFKGNLTIIK